MRAINRSAVRKIALEMAAKERPHKGISRVSESFLESCEHHLYGIIRRAIREHTVGKTLRGYTTAEHLDAAPKRRRPVKRGTLESNR